MHVAVGQADETAGDASAGPENHIGVRTAGGAHGLVLQGDLLFRGDLFEALEDGGMVAAAVRQCGAAAELDVAVRPLVHRRIVGGVGYVDDQGGLRME